MSPTSRGCAVFNPACCLSGRNIIWKATSPPLRPEGKSLLASEIAATLKQVRELQLLSGKTMEVESLKEALEYGQSRKMDRAHPLVAALVFR